MKLTTRLAIWIACTSIGWPLAYLLRFRVGSVAQAGPIAGVFNPLALVLTIAADILRPYTSVPDLIVALVAGASAAALGPSIAGALTGFGQSIAIRAPTSASHRWMAATTLLFALGFGLPWASSWRSPYAGGSIEIIIAAGGALFAGLLALPILGATGLARAWWPPLAAAAWAIGYFLILARAHDMTLPFGIHEGIAGFAFGLVTGVPFLRSIAAEGAARPGAA